MVQNLQLLLCMSRILVRSLNMKSIKVSLTFPTALISLRVRIALPIWRGIEVAVKTLGDDVAMDEEKVKAFTDELALLQKIRHPNVVHFLGAVTQSSPMMIITEYLPKGDLRAFLARKHALKPLTTVKFALDIARGMNYLHENRPAIIHRDLEPSNILRDDSGHLKVADLGLSKLLKVSKTVREHGPVSCQETSWRYVAPEIFKNEEYDTKVDVFSFALIIQEMIEGCPPFESKGEEEAAKAYCSNERPPFTAPAKYYGLGLKDTNVRETTEKYHNVTSTALVDTKVGRTGRRSLIEYCWNDKPVKRPTFRQIINKLEDIEKVLDRKRRLKVNVFTFQAGPCGCFRFLEKLSKSDPINSGSHSSTSIVR
ncbi:Integrin-linked protein kinase 1 [Bienertia sinuspersici]